MTTLHTDRLILRMLRESDFEAYAALHADPEVMRHLGEGKPLSRPEAWRSLAAMVGHWHLRGYGMWAVEERDTGRFIGRVGCWYPEGWPGFEVGWTLAREFWGKGYATEAARAALRFAFVDLGRPRIISLIRPANERSVRVAERLGERLEGKTEVNGHEALIYGLSREEWGGQ